jgi:hypothetical protein
MAVRRKGSRGILVDGVRYLWRFPPVMAQDQYDYWPGCFVTVQHADVRRGSVLVITFPQYRPDAAPDQPAVPVLPSDVARCIRAAVTKGWKPTEQGPQFVIQSEAVAKPTRST